MARRPPSPQIPQRATLSAEQMQRGVDRLRRVLAAVEEFDPSAMTEGHPPELAALEQRVKEAIEKTFDPGTTQYRRFIGAGDIAYSAMFFVMDGPPTPLSEYTQGASKNKRDSIALLGEAIRSLGEDLVEATPVTAVEVKSAAKFTLSRDIFVVHGHDEGARESVARFLEKLGFRPIILHEQANRGKTIVEKVEAHSNVSFAVVLLTPDDVGGKSGAELGPRARQNVILELGYFIGLLGRERVCALKRGDVEVPTDFAGIVYVAFEEGSDWRHGLAKELRAAGHVVDWNIVMTGQ